jgi:AcrR family transcriptional regulator
MSVKERRDREKGEMKSMILDSAHKLFLDKGFEEVSIRNIAEAIEYSPATIYLYFKDKNEIFHALHQEAFRFYNQFNAELLTIKDPFDRLVKMGEKYMKFREQHPKYYNIMFLMEAPMQNDECIDEWEEGAKAHSFLEQTVLQCMDAGYLKRADHKVLALTIWSYMHGICSLIIRNRMKMYPEEARIQMPQQSFELFMSMIKKQ